MVKAVQRRPGVPRWWVLGIAALVVTLTGAMASSRRLVAGEWTVFDSVNGLPGWLLWPVRAVMVFGTTGGALATVVLVGTGVRLRAHSPEQSPSRRWSALTPVVVSLAASVLTARIGFEVLKRVVNRNRPGRFLAELHHLHARDQAGGLGYPSGHATISMALALTLSYWRPRARWPVVILAVLVALGRLYVGVHLPLDVAGGTALGVLASAGGAAVGRRLTIDTHPAERGRDDVAH